MSLNNNSCNKGPILLFCLISCLFFACRKDVSVVTPKVTTDCPPDTNTRCSWVVTSYRVGPVQRTSPVCNPNNPDEFLYIENKEIILYNTLTKSKTTIFSSPAPVYNVKWARNNWIIFVDFRDLHLYKIRPNGSDLTVITNFNGFINAVVSVSNEILLRTRFVPIECYLMDFDGHFYDTLSSLTYLYGDLSPSVIEPKLVCQEYSKSLPTYFACISVKSFPNFITEYLYVPYDEKYRSSAYYSLAWHPNCEDVYYASSTDIQKINIKQYKHSVVKKGCTYDTYGIVAVTSDGKKLVAEAVHWYFDELCRLCYETDIVLMNIDGTNEQYLFRP